MRKLPSISWILEWVIVVYRQFSRFFLAISWGEQTNFQLDNGEGHFVLDQHAY